MFARLWRRVRRMITLHQLQTLFTLLYLAIYIVQHHITEAQELILCVPLTLRWTRLLVQVLCLLVVYARAGTQIGACVDEQVMWAEFNVVELTKLEAANKIDLVRN